MMIVLLLVLWSVKNLQKYAKSNLDIPVWNNCNLVWRIRINPYETVL